MSATNTGTTGTSTTGGTSTGGITPANAPSTLHKIGQIVELCGAGAFVAGGILSVHHYAIGACFIAGAAAFVVGRKLAQA